MLVVTSNDIPGWEIRQVCGEVFGLTVRSRNAFSQMGAGFKSLVGGELKGMTTNLVASRNEVMGRMIDEARNRGRQRGRSRCASTPPRWVTPGPRSAPTAPRWWPSR